MKCPHCGEEIVLKGEPLGAERAIEAYYRAKSKSMRRITLRSIAEKFGYNYTYLSQVKSAYDRAGKWGAKHKAKP
jgi:hypothetical protein